MEKKKEKKELKIPTMEKDPPKTLNVARRIDDIVHVPGKGGDNPRIMFVAPCATEDEVDDSTSPASFLKGPAGALFNRISLNCGIDLREEWYTALVPIALPKGKKMKPSAGLINYYSHLLEDQIERIKPEIIVCLGKVPFDYLFPLRFKLNEVIGGWFKDEKHNCLLYVMDNPVTALNKPEMIDRFHIDMSEIKKMSDTIKGVITPKIPVEYHYIDNSSQLKDIVNFLLKINCMVLSIDAEWKGKVYVDGDLRYFQFCWAPGKGARVRLRDTEKYCFDVPIEEVRKIIDPLFNKPTMRFIGHQICADALWFKHHLGVDIFGRVIFDTLYAQQTIDEYADLKLERLALQYTDIGRYDMDLMVYKKGKDFDEDDGYGSVPDEILGPYSIKDVDVPMRCWPILLKKLKEEDLDEYYFNIRLPFVTDGFFSISEMGIPCDIDILNEQRDIFVFVRNMMREIFLKDMKKEALNLLLGNLVKIDPANSVSLYQEAIMLDASDVEARGELYNKIKKAAASSDNIRMMVATLDHFYDIENFSESSPASMRRWLFDVKGYEPITTTKGSHGFKMAWEKVKNLPVNRQGDYSPATDKDTLKIYAEQGDGLVLKLLQLRAVTTLTRNFLREDDEGIHKYVTSEGKVKTNFSLTETGRPRSWKPNILNSPAYTHKMVEKAFESVHAFYEEMLKTKGDSFISYYKDKYGEEPLSLDKVKNPRPIRYNYKAEDGWCFVESDYATAEVVALGFVSNDETMIKVVTEEDKQFGLILDESGEEKPVRIAYIDSNTTITEDKKDKSILIPTDDPRLLRNKDGSLKHPKRDVHWEFAEHKNYKNSPREKLDKKTDRDGAGKVGNFSIPYGGQEDMLERKIEIDTGVKPEPGTGAKIKETYQARYEVASNFLQEREEDPIYPGYYKSVTGAKRHYHVPDINLEGLSENARERIISPLRREARNYPIQSIVGDTLARAVVNLNRYFREQGMKARVVCPLYDACYTYCPLEERFKVKEAHQRFMCDENTWEIHGRTLKFDIDTKFTIHWSTKPTEEQKKKLNDPEYRVAK